MKFNVKCAGGQGAGSGGRTGDAARQPLPFLQAVVRHRTRARGACALTKSANILDGPFAWLCGRLLIAAILLLSTANAAQANLEINGLFDARSAGMGGTGVAYLDSAGAIPTNPALLDQIKTLTLSVDAFLIAAQPEAPYKVYHQTPDGRPYQQYETIRSPATAAVLPFLGGAFRILDRVVIGAAVYPIIGQGTTATYRPAPDTYPEIEYALDMAMGLVEAAVPISVRILDNLSIAASWRLTYMTQHISLPLEGGPPFGGVLDPMGNVVYTDIETTGTNFTGFQLGMFWKPQPYLRLGLSYRSEVVVTGEGTATVADFVGGGEPTVRDLMQDITNPAGLRAGVALSFLEDRLLVAGDFKYLMYSSGWKNTVTITRDESGEEETDIRPTNWTDAFALQLGTEYVVADTVALRAGYSLTPTSTPAAFALPYMPPPGIAHLLTVGAGIKVLDEALSIDAALGYVMLESKVYTPTEYNGGPGIYASHAGEASLSLTYRL